MYSNPIQRSKEVLNFINIYGIDGYWIFDMKSKKIVFINSLLIKLLGYEYQRQSQVNACKQYINEVEKAHIPLLNLTKESVDEKSGIVSYTSSMGNAVHFHLRCKIFTEEENTFIIGAHSEHFNAAKDNEKQQLLMAQNERLKFIIEGTDVGTWEWNIQTGETVFNEKWANIIGYTLEELYPVNIDTWIKFCHPEDLKASNKLIEDHIAGKSKIYDVEARMQHKSGAWVWVHDKGKVVSWTEDGKPEWMVGSHQEITDTIIAREQNKRFVEQAPIAIAMFNNDIEYLAASKSWLEDYNIVGENIIGKSHYDIFPEIGEDWKNFHQSALKGNVHKCDGELFERANGHKIWIRWEVRPWFFKDNSIGGIIMYTQDITVEKTAEEKLRVSEATFRNNFESSSIGMVIVQPDGTLSTVNQSLCDILGYTKEELEQLTFQEITYPEDLEKDLELLHAVIDNKRDGYQMEKRYIHKNGKIIHAVLSVSVVRNADGTPLYFVSQVTDISLRVEAQIELKSTLSKLESIVNGSTQVSIIGTDLEGNINLFNIGAENLLGYKREDMLYKQNPGLIHKEEEMVARSAQLTREYNRPVRGFEVFTTVPNAEGFESREWTYIRKDGSEFKVLLTVNPISNGEKVIGYVGIAVDISQLLIAQDQIKSLLQLKQSQNERFSNFAYIVSHNLKTYTNNLSGLINLFIRQNKEQEDSKVFQFLTQSVQGLSDTVEHLNEVLTISSEKVEFTKIHLNKILENSLTNLSINAQKGKVKFINKVREDYYVLGINAYVESIFFNFISNAIKYQSDDVESYLEISAYYSNNYVAINFKDNGLGINLEKHRKKLFGMYNTFHKHEEARGIGLFITHNQVEAMNGKIEVESKLGKGTTFTVYLRKA